MNYNEGILMTCITILALLILVLVLGKGNLLGRKECDERMAFSRMKGINIAYSFVMLGVAIIALEVVTGNYMPMDLSCQLFIVLFLGYGITSIYGVLNDSFYSLRDNKKMITVILGIDAVLFLIISVVQFVKGLIMVDGKVTVGILPVLFFILIVGMFVAMLINEKQHSKED